VNKRTGGDIIPGNVSGRMVDLEGALGVVIKDPKMKAQMDSMLNVMQALARDNPQQASALGQRITGSVMAANDKLNAAANLYQKVKDSGVDFIFNTPRGKDFLFKARGLKPGSPAMDALIRQETPLILAPKNLETMKPLPQAAQTESNSPLAENKP